MSDSEQSDSPIEDILREQALAHTTASRERAKLKAALQQAATTVNPADDLDGFIEAALNALDEMEA